MPISKCGGGTPTHVFPVPSGAQGLRWSPNGKSLQFLLTRNGATNIWEQPLSGGDPRQFTTFTSGRIFDFHWSLDGKDLFLAKGDITSDVILISNFDLRDLPSFYSDLLPRGGDIEFVSCVIRSAER